LYRGGHYSTPPERRSETTGCKLSVSTTKAENQVKGALFLDVIIRKRASVLQLLPSEDQALLVGRNTFFVLNLRLDVVDRIGGLDLERDRLPCQSLHENLHASTEAEDKVESRLLLNVIIRQSATIFELLPGEDQALLIGRNAFLVLDLGLDIVDGVRGLHLQRDGLAREGLDKNLHATTQTKDKVEGRLLLDVVIRKGTTVLQLLSGKNETLLVRGDAFLILDLGLDVVDSVRRLYLKSDGLPSKGLHEDLHAATQTKNEMEGGLFLDVVVRKGPSVPELFSRKDETLLVGGDAFLVLDLGLDVIDGVRRFNLEGDGLPSERLHENLHSDDFEEWRRGELK
jgi:hypothetical protein